MMIYFGIILTSEIKQHNETILKQNAKQVQHTSSCHYNLYTLFDWVCDVKRPCFTK